MTRGDDCLDDQERLTAAILGEISKAFLPENKVREYNSPGRLLLMMKGVRSAKGEV